MTTHGYDHAEILVRRELSTQANLLKKGIRSPLNNPMLLGPVGGGKTSIAVRACNDYQLTLLAINGGENSDPTDVSGVPVPSMIRNLMHEGTVSERSDARGAYMEWVLNRYASMACLYPSFLFFDDVDKAKPAIQGALLGVTANRTFRDKSLHEGTLIMCAGNRTEDDKLANDITESLRTRVTQIEMIPDVLSFTKYGRETLEIEESVIGYVNFKPAHLYLHRDDVARFPTPRGWWEVSQQMREYPDPMEDVFKNGSKDNWKGIVSRKVGDFVANDFWAWFKILKTIDVNQILLHGTTPAQVAGDRRMYQYASVFAVSSELNRNGVKPTYKGLESWVVGLDPEMRIALTIQIKTAVRSKIATMFKSTATAMLAEYVMTKKGQIKATTNIDEKDGEDEEKTNK